jgi:hypothetical protein
MYNIEDVTTRNISDPLKNISDPHIPVAHLMFRQPYERADDKKCELVN